MVAHILEVPAGAAIARHTLLPLVGGHQACRFGLRDVGEGETLRRELHLGAAYFTDRPQIRTDAVKMADPGLDMKRHRSAVRRRGNVLGAGVKPRTELRQPFAKPAISPKLARHAQHRSLLLSFTVAAVNGDRGMFCQPLDLLGCLRFDIRGGNPARSEEHTPE